LWEVRLFTAQPAILTPSKLGYGPDKPSWPGPASRWDGALFYDYHLWLQSPSCTPDTLPGKLASQAKLAHGPYKSSWPGPTFRGWETTKLKVGDSGLVYLHPSLPPSAAARESQKLLRRFALVCLCRPLHHAAQSLLYRWCSRMISVALFGFPRFFISISTFFPTDPLAPRFFSPRSCSETVFFLSS